MIFLFHDIYCQCAITFFLGVYSITYKYVHIVRDLFIPNECDYLIKKKEKNDICRMLDIDMFAKEIH